MFTYITAVLIVILILSLFLTYLLKRNNLLNFLMLRGIVVGSAVISIMLPFILNFLLGASSIGFFTAVLMSFLIYIILLAAFALAISQLMYRDNFEVFIKKLITQNIGSFSKRFVLSTGECVENEMINSTNCCTIDVIDNIERLDNIDNLGNVDKLDNIEDLDNIDKLDNIEKIDELAANEKPVDTEQNIGTIGIDNNTLNNVDKNDVLDSFDIQIPKSTEKYVTSSTDINEIIEEIFSKKQNGDLEGALALYFEIIEAQPEDSLVFWLVPEICLLLKQLGQQEFAKFVLNDYALRYGDLIKTNEIFDFI